MAVPKKRVEDIRKNSDLYRNTISDDTTGNHYYLALKYKKTYYKAMLDAMWQAEHPNG